jgi:microsomal prostaglandin-E synthase 2
VNGSWLVIKGVCAGEVSNFSGLYGLPAKYVGAGIMYLVGKRVAKRHGYDSANPRQALYDAVDKWMSEAVGGSSFSGGATPDLSDLAVFGVLRAIEGLE